MRAIFLRLALAVASLTQLLCPSVGAACIEYLGYSAGTGRGSGNSVNATAPKPPGTQPGDFLLATLAFSKGGTVNITPPGDWQLVDRVNQDREVGLAVYGRFASAIEPENYQFRVTAGPAWSLAISRYQHVRTDQPVHVSVAASGYGNEPTAPSMTLATNGALALTVFAGDDATSMSPPGGMTQRYDVPNLQQGEPSHMAATRLVATGGVADAKSAGISAPQNWVALHIALNPTGCSFELSRAYIHETDGVAIEWSGSEWGDCRVDYADDEGYSIRLETRWQVAGQVSGNRFVDRGDAGAGRIPPAALDDRTMRFYRVARVDDPDQPPFFAAASNRRLQQGSNFLAFNVDPVPATMDYAFGLDRLPAGSPHDAHPDNTTIFVYTNSLYGDASPVQFALVHRDEGPGQWRYTVDGIAWSDANDQPPPLDHALNLRLPAATNLLMAGRVRPLQGDHVIQRGVPGFYNLFPVGFSMPVAVDDLPGLRVAMQAYLNQVRADRLVIINNQLNPPTARYLLYRRTGDDTFRYAGGGAAGHHRLFPGEVIAYRPQAVTVNDEPRDDLLVDFTPAAKIIALDPRY